MRLSKVVRYVVQLGSTSAVGGSRALRSFVVLALALFALGAGPTACVGDVELPACLKLEQACGGSTSGAAGSAGLETSAGGGGTASTGTADAGEAGGDAAGSGGDGGDGGVSEGGGGALGGGGLGGGGLGGGAGSQPGTSGTGGVVGCGTCLISPALLPAPCANKPYATSLSVTGGTAPYAWAIVPPAGQWTISLDPSSSVGAKAFLNGLASTSGQVGIQITDATGAVALKTYAIEPRGACLFAYTALQATDPQLQLLDPLLPLQAQPPLAHNQGVYDFAFSPNGQYLVYRYGADATHPKGRHLSLLNLSTLSEQSLPFAEEAVTAYAWSKSSKNLAVAFTHDGASYLGGMKVPANDATGLAATPVPLIPMPTLIDSDLYWIGEGYVGFYAVVLIDPTQPGVPVPNPFDQVTPFYSSLGANGFASPSYIDSTFNNDVSLQAADDGLWIIAGTDPKPYFQLISPAASLSSHYFTQLVSPSGKFGAETPDDQLTLYASGAGDLDAPTFQAAPGEGCPRLLAWAKGKERIACVADVTNPAHTLSHGEVRIFDVPEAPRSPITMKRMSGYCEQDTSTLPAVSSCGALEYDYTQANSVAQARALSDSGRWFAFATGTSDGTGPNYLYWADVSGPVITLKRKVFVQGSGMTSFLPTGLAYSGDEKFLMLQRGSLLTVHDLNAGPNDQKNGPPGILTSQLMASSAPLCSEDFPTASKQWCGSADRALAFVWAPDSRYLAYRSLGKLTVADITGYPGSSAHPLLATACDQQCSNQFAFQPQP